MDEATSSQMDTSSSSATVIQKKSKNWLHVTKNRDQTFSCKYCTIVFSAGSNLTTFKRHVNQKHPEMMENAHSAGSVPQPPFNPQETTDKFIKWIVCDLQPFTTAERPEFVDFVKSFNQSYTLPSADHTKTLIMRRYRKNKISISEMLQDIPGSISLTADIWSSCAKQSYLGVTAHFIDADWTMQHIVLEVLPFGHPHTGEAIKEAIQDILEDFGITTQISGIGH